MNDTLFHSQARIFFDDDDNDQATHCHIAIQMNACHFICFDYES